MPTWFVSGGAGFIGSHLCHALRARGDRVRVLDDMSTGKRANLPDGVELTIGDAADADIVRTMVDGVDGCFHLAAIASVERGMENWLGTHRVNLTATIALFDALRRQPIKPPVVYASSAAVYGTPTPQSDAQQPIAEDTPCHPLSAYGADKLGCEHHARVATHVHGIPTIGLRFFNVYGPRQDPASPYSGVISIFCNRIRRGEPIDVFGDGGQTRDFIFVSDVVIALLAAMDKRPPGAPVFNVCTGTPTSVKTLAQTIADLANARPEIRHRPPRSGEIRHSTGSPERARAVLGTPPPLALRAGLAQVLDWLASAA